MREIPKKNYVIFAVVIVISLFIVGYFVRWYQMTNGREETTMMDGVVSEVRYDELTSYLQDNPNVIVYIAPNIQGSNITLENEKIKFNNNCIFCLGCLHKCPVQAIDYKGNIEKNGQYIFPKELEI